MTNMHAPRRSSEALGPAGEGRSTGRSVGGAVATPVLARPILLESRDPEGVVRACVRSLVGLAYRTPGFDVQVSGGPETGWAVRLHHAADGLHVQLLEEDEETGRDVPLTPQSLELDAELDALLRG